MWPCYYIGAFCYITRTTHCRITKYPLSLFQVFNTLRPRQDGRHFPDDRDFSSAFFLNENVWITIKFSVKFVPEGPINNIPALVQIMAWRRPGDKPLSDPMLVSLPTHICVTRPQWVKACFTSIRRHYHPLCGMRGSVWYSVHLRKARFSLIFRPTHGNNR